MRNKYTEKLEQLNNEMIEMGTMVEKAIEDAVVAFINHDVEAAQKIIEADDNIDKKEKEIENICFKLILHQQPVAGDLREISTALKMVTDIERIGDHAADISELTMMMPGDKYMGKAEHISAMTKETIFMLVESINAFVDMDKEKAEEVIKHDDIVDGLFVKVKKELIELIHSDVNNGEQAVDLLLAAKYLERIGDHAENVSEWVIYSITGER